MNIIDFEDVARGAVKPDAAYRIRVDFMFEELTCTRILVVSPDVTLDDLHTMIQACGNWLNYHFYDFRFIHDGRFAKAQPSWQLAEMGQPGGDVLSVDSEQVKLSEAFNDYPAILYSYDYGDGWEIMITRLGFGIRPNKPVPYCESGKGDWPPDDVGGEGGLQRLLEIVKDPFSEDGEDFLLWANEQGFEKYQLSKCNQRLSNWHSFKAIVEQ